MAFFLFVGFGVFDEIPFEGGHLTLVEKRGVGAAPEIPVIVARIVLVGRRGIVVESLTHEHSYLMEELASAVFLSVDHDFFERAVGVERHGGMEQ